MTRAFASYRSGLHRFAGRALFRALLGVCRTAPLQPEVRETLQHVVRNTFRKRILERSRRKLAIWFQGGYDVCDWLERCCNE